MILTFPFTCEMDFPPVADWYFVHFILGENHVCMIVGRKLIDFSGDAECFRSSRKCSSHGEVCCVFWWHSPHVSPMCPVLTFCPCNLYEAKRMNPIFVRFRVLDIRNIVGILRSASQPPRWHDWFSKGLKENICIYITNSPILE